MLRDALRDRRVVNYILHSVLLEEFFQYVQVRPRATASHACVSPWLPCLGSSCRLPASGHPALAVNPYLHQLRAARGLPPLAVAPNEVGEGL